MQYLIEYTGGNIILIVSFISLLILSLIISLIKLFSDVIKSNSINKKQKKDFITTITSIVIITACVFATISYYFCIWFNQGTVK